MRRVGSIANACMATLILAGSTSANAQATTVQLELVLAVDVSGSVSPAEFALQRGGLAAAFRDPAVHGAIEASGGNGIAVALLHWAGPREQAFVVGWSRVFDATSAEAFAAKIETAERGFAGVTAVGEALLFAASATDANAYRSDRIVIDVSGDGPTNFGRATQPARDGIVAAGITVNGLAIIDEVADLEAYYRDQVVGGPGSFVGVAANSEDFVRAIRGKLIQEILGGPSS